MMGVPRAPPPPHGISPGSALPRCGLWVVVWIRNRCSHCSQSNMCMEFSPRPPVVWLVGLSVWVGALWGGIQSHNHTYQYHHIRSHTIVHYGIALKFV